MSEPVELTATSELLIESDFEIIAGTTASIIGTAVNVPLDTEEAQIEIGQCVKLAIERAVRSRIAAAPPLTDQCASGCPHPRSVHPAWFCSECDLEFRRTPRHEYSIDPYHPFDTIDSLRRQRDELHVAYAQAGEHIAGMERALRVTEESRAELYAANVLLQAADKWRVMGIERLERELESERAVIHDFNQCDLAIVTLKTERDEAIKYLLRATGMTTPPSTAPSKLIAMAALAADQSKRMHDAVHEAADEVRALRKLALADEECQLLARQVILIAIGMEPSASFSGSFAFESEVWDAIHAARGKE